MKKLFLVSIFSGLLVGCQTTTPEIKTIHVPKPFPFCPAPPQVPSEPSTGFQVDKLTEADKQDPGKVAQAYKHDMLFLRRITDIYSEILSQYKLTSQNFEKTKKLIDELFSKMDEEVKQQNETAKKD